ncbi:MbnH family di-heme enzyme [Colwelliaceae bacterium 6471]
MNHLSNIIIVLFVTGLLISCSSEEKLPPYQWSIPKGFPKPQVPLDNPMSLAKVELGKVLFFDKNLSANQKQSCASCHIQQYAFAENRDRSVGSTGMLHRRNAPALVNIAYNKTLTWAHDGITSLEQQILLPMFGQSPVELGITGHEQQVWSRFQTPRYRTLFAKAFPNVDIAQAYDISYFDLIVKALASYVRSLISLNSPFDDYAYQGQDNAISDSALRGMNLFFSEKFECHHCHGGFNFTQSTSHEQQLIDRRPFHNTGLYYVNHADDSSGYPSEDIGLGEISALARDNGRFRAPTLRNITVSAPYMHDGSIATLSDVLDFYASGGRNIVAGINMGDGRKNPLKSPFVKGFAMSEQDKIDLLAFLETLTDQVFLTNPLYRP